MRILIAGRNSYVGTRTRDLMINRHGCEVTEVDMVSGAWRQEKDLFQGVDAVLHVAAIVHRPSGAVRREEYHRVNTLLPVEVAQRARLAGVGHFIFISTMSVYGGEKTLPNSFVIDASTPLGCDSPYGQSKLEAEDRLKELRDQRFKVSIIRPPSVYGVGCPGNYIRRFVQIADRLPVFPDAFGQCRQGFLHIDNLGELVFQILATGTQGCFTPQDDAGASTVELIRLIASARNRRVHFSKSLGRMVSCFGWHPMIKKLYGGIVYDPSVILCENLNYQLTPFEVGMRETVQSF